MNKVFADGDLYTYILRTTLGEFKLFKKLDNKNILLYHKVDSYCMIRNEVERAIIIPTRFVGFEEIVGNQYHKSQRFIYKKPFEYVFTKYERNVSTSVLYELDNDSNLVRKEAIDNWRLSYQEAKKYSFLNDEFCRFKTNYYKFDLPILRQTISRSLPICERCVGYGFIPLYFGIGLTKDGRCYKCGGSGTLKKTDSINDIMARKLKDFDVKNILNESSLLPKYLKITSLRIFI
jgi:hypothetical protein